MLVIKEQYRETVDGVDYDVSVYENENGDLTTVREMVSEVITPTEPEPTQLDRIESMVAKSQEEIAQEARDAYTLELIEGGVIA